MTAQGSPTQNHFLLGVLGAIASERPKGEIEVSEELVREYERHIVSVHRKPGKVIVKVTKRKTGTQRARGVD